MSFCLSVIILLFLNLVETWARIHLSILGRCFIKVMTKMKLFYLKIYYYSNCCRMWHWKQMDIFKGWVLKSSCQTKMEFKEKENLMFGQILDSELCKRTFQCFDWTFKVYILFTGSDFFFLLFSFLFLFY